MFWQFSRMACNSALSGLGVPTDYTDPNARSCNTTTFVAEAGSGEVSSGAAGRRVSEGSCTYPIHEGNQPSSLTGLKARHWPQQSGWYGPLMNIQTFSGKTTQLLEQTHSLIATNADGTSSGTTCFLPTGGTDAGDGSATEEERVKEARRTFYTGGVMGTVKREAFTMRSFHFADASMKAAAMAVSSDTLNPGLQYAKSCESSRAVI